MKRYIKTSAQIDPKYQGNKYIDRVDVVQGDEGSIPHFHVLIKDGTISYPRIDCAEYSSHHKDGRKLNSKERNELNSFLKRVNYRNYIKSFTTDEVKVASNYGRSVDVWVETYDGLEKFELDGSGFPIQPDYTKLS